MRTTALLALTHLGLMPATGLTCAWADPTGGLAVHGAVAAGEVEALFARQEARPARARDGAVAPARTAAGRIDVEGQPGPADALSSSGDADPLADWAESCLADFRLRGIEAVTLEECQAFVAELRARDGAEWLSEALLYLGYSRMFAGELEEALAEWREAARLGVVWGRSAGLAKAQNALGIGYRQGGDLVTARNHFELAALYSEDEEEAKGFRVNLASCEMGLGNLGRAFDQFASILNELSDAQACIAYYNLSDICLTSELFEAAGRLSERCLEKYDLVPEQVQRLAGSTIGVQLLLHHAECLNSHGDAEGAESALTRAGAEELKLGEVPLWAQGELLSRKASIALQNDAFEEALDILAPLAREMARAGRPPSYLDSHVQRLLATALEGAGRLREALDVLDQVDATQVAAGSYLELDLNELRISIWDQLAQSIAAGQGQDDSNVTAAGSSGAVGEGVGDAGWVERTIERRDWRHVERSIIQANFARPELAPLLGDLAMVQWGARGDSRRNPSSGVEGGNSRRAARVALAVAGLLGIGGLVLGMRANRRAKKVLQLETLVEDLREQRREVADRAAAVSHDLRAPVLALRCCLDLLGLDASSPNVRNRIEPMRKGLEHIIRLADDSLLLHGLAAREAAALIEPCDLAEVLEPVFELWRPMAECKQLELRFDVAPGTHLWSIDADHAVRMVENLLSNAVKFAEGPGVIEVSLVSKNGYGQLSVKDCGPGLPEHELPRLFEPMARLTPRPTDDEVSSGLGTSIVRALAERYGGWVHAANNEPGPGLTVSVCWPCRVDVATAGALPSRARESAPTDGEPQRKASFAAAEPTTNTDRGHRG